jgi:probable phosphoglycerate mutase
MNGTGTTLVFAVRHGETEWNLTGRQQGHLDSRLTERGVQQAHALARGLAGRGIEFVFSSDLGRASATADIIGARLGLPVQTDERLRERHVGGDSWRLDTWGETHHLRGLATLDDN